LDRSTRFKLLFYGLLLLTIPAVAFAEPQNDGNNNALKDAVILVIRHVVMSAFDVVDSGSPWQNPYAERLIGTIRRDRLDHILIFGERHLRRVLTPYSRYYNETRTHLGLGKDAPLRRAVQRSGTIVTTPILSGFHHHYARI
jgi:hypothetical protein